MSLGPVLCGTLHVPDQLNCTGHGAFEFYPEDGTIMIIFSFSYTFSVYSPCPKVFENSIYMPSSWGLIMLLDFN